MNKLFKFFMFLSIPLMSAMLVSCGGDDPDPEPELLAPSITSVSPGQADPGGMVTITGTNLADVTSVRFGDTDATFTADNNTTISATVPATAEAGTQTITVVAPGGEDTYAFTVTDPTAPTFVSFSPSSGPVGTEVTVVGTNLNRITSAQMGDVAITDWAVAADNNTATFTIPEGAATGTLTLTPDSGDPLVSTESFTVIEEGTTVAEHTVEVHAQGDRYDEGIHTAFNAQGETFHILDGVDNGEAIDFIAADSGGDDNLDLFSPSQEGWLPGNYYEGEDDDDPATEWSTMNDTQMRLLEPGEVDFDAATAEDINALELGDDPSDRISPDDQGVGAVILFLTADGEKGLVRWSEHDPNAAAGSKMDIFTFDIKVLE